MAARRPRIFIYSHDTYGLGHLRRSLLIAESLGHNMSPAPVVLIATGSPRTHSFECPPGTDTIKLPSVVKTADGRYRPRTLDVSLAEIVRLRSNLLIESARSFAPDVVIVDHSPAGMEGELRPMFRALATLRRPPRIVLGLRDIIDDAARVRAEWDREDIWSLIDRVYDRVLVYGDPKIKSTASELDLETRYPGKIVHTGYLGRQISNELKALAKAEPPRVLVSTGGGGDGQNVLRAYASFLESLPGKAPFHSTIVTGPFLSRRRQVELTQRFHASGQPVEVLEFTNRMEELHATSSATISMAGYNTAVEVLANGVPALFVPRSAPRLEQTIRAERLAACSPVTWCSDAACTPERIASFLESALSPESRAAAERSDLDLTGLKRLALEITKLAATANDDVREPSPIARRAKHPTDVESPVVVGSTLKTPA